MSTSRYLLMTLAVLSSGSLQSAFAQTSTFNASSEGWTVVSFASLAGDDYTMSGPFNPTFNLTGGNPGGYISTNDPSVADFTFAAPIAFLGNKSGATGLSYDLNHTDFVSYQTTDLMLVGGGERLLYKITPDFIPTPTFTTINVGFTPSASWHVDTTTGALATNSDFDTVLGNLTGLYIRGEYSNHGETAGLDNVTLIGASDVPEPGTYALFVASALSGAAFLKRRKQANKSV